MRCWSSCSSTTMRPMFGSFMRGSPRSTWLDAHPEEAAGARRDAHTMVDTVTDDPQRESVGTAASAPADTIGASRGARPDARLGERVADELRAAPTERPEPLAGARDPHDRDRRRRDRRRTPRTPRPSGHATGGAVLDPRLDRDRAEAGAARELRARRARRRSAELGAVDEVQAARRRARPDRRPGARRRAARRARRRARASTVAERRRRRCRATAGRRAGRARAAARASARRVVGRVLGRERVEQLVVVAQQRRPGGRAPRRGRGRRRARAAG